jgi:hypothetical protein
VGVLGESTSAIYNFEESYDSGEKYCTVLSLNLVHLLRQTN